ncbi:MAG: carbohydrate ABC transporter permease, partial [Chloroflexi bacterium]
MAVTTSSPQAQVYARTVFFDRLRKYLFFAMLAFWAVLSVAPLYFTLVFSFKPVADIYTPPIWAPLPFTFENYITILG